MKIPKLKIFAFLKQKINSNASTDADDNADTPNTDVSITITKEVPKTIIADGTIHDLAVQYAKNLISGKPFSDFTKDWDDATLKKFNVEFESYLYSRFILLLREHEEEKKLKKQHEKEIMQAERELEERKHMEIKDFKVPEYEDVEEWDRNF